MTRLLFALALAVGLAPAAYAQDCAAGTIDGAFVETSAGPYAPGDIFEATLFLSRQTAPLSDLGTSTMVLDYNDAAMTYAADPVSGTDYTWLRYDGGGLGSPLPARPTIDGELSAYRASVEVTNSSRLTPFTNIIDTSSPDLRGEEVPATPTAVLVMRWTIVDASEGIVVSPRSQQFFDGPGGPTGCYSDGTFTGLEVGQQTTSGGAGWRMLAAPAGGLSPDDLAGLNYLQGFPSHTPQFPTNLYAGYDGANYLVPETEETDITPGTGLIWYMYDAADFPDGTPPDSHADLPVSLTHGGPAAASLVAGGELGTDSYTVPLHAVNDRWNLVGNPFATSLDVSQIVPVGGVFNSAVVQMWDPASGDTGSSGAGSYVLSSDQADTVTGWQGFFLENASASDAAVPVEARVSGGPFVGLTRDEPVVQARGAARSRIAFTLDGQAADGTALLDRALALELDPAASADWDLRDASKLTPLTERYAALAFVGQQDGERVLKAQESQPLTDDGFTVPLALDLAGGDADLTLRWDLADLPEDLAVALRDLATGAEVDLRTATTYDFSAEATRQARAAAPATSLRHTADDRFLLAVGRSFPVSSENASSVDALALSAAAPNPFRSHTTLRFALPTAGPARLAVYDVLGRQVAVLADGEHAAGRHQARFDGSSFASGIYVVRLEADGEALTRRVTITR